MEASAQDELNWVRHNRYETPEQHLDFDFRRQKEPSTPESGLRKVRPAVSKRLVAIRRLEPHAPQQVQNP